MGHKWVVNNAKSQEFEETGIMMIQYLLAKETSQLTAFFLPTSCFCPTLIWHCILVLAHKLRKVGAIDTFWRAVFYRFKWTDLWIFPAELHKIFFIYIIHEFHYYHCARMMQPHILTPLQYFQPSSWSNPFHTFIYCWQSEYEKNTDILSRKKSSRVVVPREIIVHTVAHENSYHRLHTGRSILVENRRVERDVDDGLIKN